MKIVNRSWLHSCKEKLLRDEEVLEAVGVIAIIIFFVISGFIEGSMPA